jgi:hypothetical protein
MFIAMSNNPYNDFKSGIKKDIRGFVLNTFGAFGAFGLILCMLMTLGYVFYKDNHFGIITKTVTGISIFVLTALLFNARIANKIYTAFLCLILIVVLIIVIVVCGGFIYLIGKPMMKDYF